MAKKLSTGVFQTTERKKAAPRKPKAKKPPEPAEIEPSDMNVSDEDKYAVAAEFWRIASNTDIPEDGYIRNVGVGLRESEIQTLDRYAKPLGVGRNALIRQSVRMLIQQIEAGLLTLDTETVPPTRRTTKRIVVNP